MPKKPFFKAGSSDEEYFQSSKRQDRRMKRPIVNRPIITSHPSSDLHSPFSPIKVTDEAAA